MKQNNIFTNGKLLFSMAIISFIFFSFIGCAAAWLFETPLKCPSYEPQVTSTQLYCGLPQAVSIKNFGVHFPVAACAVTAWSTTVSFEMFSQRRSANWELWPMCGSMQGQRLEMIYIRQCMVLLLSQACTGCRASVQWLTCLLMLCTTYSSLSCRPTSVAC